jgi:hypothetical protein
LTTIMNSCGSNQQTPRERIGPSDSTRRNNDNDRRSTTFAADLPPLITAAPHTEPIDSTQKLSHGSTPDLVPTL